MGLQMFLLLIIKGSVFLFHELASVANYKSYRPYLKMADSRINLDSLNTCKRGLVGYS